MKKGFVIPIIAMALLVVTTVAYYLIYINDSAHEASIILRGERALSLSHHTELLRKMIYESISLTAHRAAYDLGIEGGGVDLYWTYDRPTLDELIDRFEGKMSSLLPSGVMEGGLAHRKIVFSSPVIEVDRYSDISDADQDFDINLNYSVQLIDDKITAKSYLEIENYKKTIASDYFKLLQIGRNLFEEQSYSVNTIPYHAVCSPIPSPIPVNYKTENYIHYSVLCGLGDTVGLAGLSNQELTDSTVIKNRLNDTAFEMKTRLESEYADVAFDITPSFTGSSNHIVVEMDFVLTGTKRIPITMQEMDDLGLLIPEDNLTLNFKTTLEFDYELDEEAPKYVSVFSMSRPIRGHYLKSDWGDNRGLSYAILSTNETGSWENKTSYGSPYDLQSKTSHLLVFDWDNDTITDDSIILWKVYVNDTSNNWNVTEEQQFTK